MSKWNKSFIFAWVVVGAVYSLASGAVRVHIWSGSIVGGRTVLFFHLVNGLNAVQDYALKTISWWFHRPIPNQNPSYKIALLNSMWFYTFDDAHTRNRNWIPINWKGDYQYRNWLKLMSVCCYWLMHLGRVFHIKLINVLSNWLRMLPLSHRIKCGCPRSGMECVGAHFGLQSHLIRISEETFDKTV